MNDGSSHHGRCDKILASSSHFAQGENRFEKIHHAHNQRRIVKRDSLNILNNVLDIFNGKASFQESVFQPADFFFGIVTGMTRVSFEPTRKMEIVFGCKL